MLTPDAISTITYATGTYTDAVERAARQEYKYRITVLKAQMKQELVTQGYEPEARDIVLTGEMLRQIRDDVLYDVIEYVKSQLDLAQSRFQFRVYDAQQQVKLKEIKNTFSQKND